MVTGIDESISQVKHAFTILHVGIADVNQIAKNLIQNQNRTKINFYVKVNIHQSNISVEKIICKY